jgi:hypothetical protein
LFSARLAAPWPGLILMLLLAGPHRTAAGRPEEGTHRASPLLLGRPELILAGEHGVDLAGQVFWSDPDRIYVLGLVPSELLAIEPGSGLTEVLAVEGPGPFDLDGPVSLLSRGRSGSELLVHQPGRSRTVAFPRGGSPYQIRFGAPVTGCVVSGESAWWLRPRIGVPGGRLKARIDLVAGPAPAPGPLELVARPIWSERPEGTTEEILLAQFFTRLLPGPEGRIWRVVLGTRPRVDLLDPREPSASRLAMNGTEGACIEASVTAEGVLHLLTAGGHRSRGRRILRFDPEPLVVLVGDRDWSTGAVDPTGERWVGVDAEESDVLLYELPRFTRDRSNR